ncbi:MAG: AAA family ATPase [Planctomycetaceae bacterium]
MSSVADSASFCRTLFRFDERLVDPELALRRLRDFLGSSIYETTMAGIKRAIGLRPADHITVEKGGGVIVTTTSGTFPLSALADGHRVPFGFALDLYHSALQAKEVTETGGIRGILLLDEIEQHLHPALQEGVLRRFGRLWPEMQIFATTHSPLVALGAKPDEVVSLKRRGASVSAIWPVPNFTAFTADDMLEEQRLFDTASMTPANTKELTAYQQLAAIPRAKRSKSQNAKLKKLATAQLAGQPEAAQSNPLGDLMLDVRKKFGL